MKQKAPLHKPNCHKDYLTSPIHPIMVSPHTGQPMTRVFVRDNKRGIVTRSQFWKCNETGALIQDEYQKLCRDKAAKLASENSGIQTYYHTMAWKAGEGPDDVPRKLKQ